VEKTDNPQREQALPAGVLYASIVGLDFSNLIIFLSFLRYPC